MVEETATDLQKIQRHVRRQEKKTFKYHHNCVNLLIKTTDLMDAFFISYAWVIEPHLSSVTKGKYLHRSNLPPKAKRALDLVEHEINLLDIFPQLWEELGETIRNLIACNYRSVSRSLRWLIESTIFWMYVELDKEINNAMEHFDNNCISMPFKHHSYSFNVEYIIHYNSDLLDERLRLKEKYGRPSIGESGNRLEDFKITNKTNPKIKSNVDRIKEINSTIDKMKTQLTELYHDFSAFSHISVESLEWEGKNPQYYPYSMDYGYSKTKFSPALENLWKVIDLSASIIVLVCSRFYGYQMPNEYLDAILTHQKRMQNEPAELVNLTKSDPVRKNIPIFSTLVKTDMQR